MKIPILFMLLASIMLSTTASATTSYYQNQFNDSSTSKNVSFSGTPGYNDVIWISIPKRVNVTSMSMSMHGYNNYTPSTIPNGTINITYKMEGVGAFYTTIGKCTNSTGYEFRFMQETAPSGNNTYSRYLDSRCNDGSGVANISFDLYNATLGTQTLRLYEAVINFPKNYNLTGINAKHASGSGSEQAIYPYNNSIDSNWNSFTCPTNSGLYFVLEIDHFLPFPQNISVDISNDGTAEYINNSITNITLTSIFNSTAIAAINNYITNNCSVDWATGNCSVPFNVSSLSPGILGLYDMNVSGYYSDYGFGNCSSPYVALLNLSFRDEESGGLLHGNLSFSMNATDSNSTEYSFNYSAQNITYYTICGLNGTLNADMFLEYGATGYSTRHYFLDDAQIGFNTTDIYLYLLTSGSSQETTFTVNDVYQIPESNMIIQALRYFPDIDDYKLVTMGKTGSSGTDMLQLKPNQYYKYVLVRGNAIIFMSDTQQLIGTSIVLFSSTETDIGFFSYYGNVGCACAYNQSNTLLSCIYSDTSGKLVNMTLTVSDRPLNGTAWTTICTDYLTSASGTLSCNLSSYNQTNTTLYYEINGRHCCSEETVINFIRDILIMGSRETVRWGLTGLLMGGFIVLAVSSIGFYNPKLGILMGTLSFVIVNSVLGIINVSWPITGAMITTAAILMFLVGRDKNES